MSLPLLRPILEELSYPRIDRLKELNDTSKQEQMIDALKSSVRGTWAIVFLKGYFADLTPYGASFSLFGLSTNKEPNNYLLYDPQLKCESMRLLFTGTETIIFKLVQLLLEPENERYFFESEKTRARLKRLKGKLDIDDFDIFYSLFDDIFFVRDAFAHSFISLKEIEYRGTPLQYCYTRTHRMDASEEMPSFIADYEIYWPDICQIPRNSNATIRPI